MATISNFKCSKCGKEFSLRLGLLKSSFSDDNGKPVDEETGAKLWNQRTTENSLKFQGELTEHPKNCDGEVKYTGVVFAD